MSNYTRDRSHIIFFLLLRTITNSPTEGTLEHSWQIPRNCRNSFVDLQSQKYRKQNNPKKSYKLRYSILIKSMSN